MLETEMKIETLDFGTFKIGDRLVIGEMKEGVDIQLGQFTQLVGLAEEHFKGDKWGYISNRVNVYSLQPMVHREASKIALNMVAFAIVTKQDLHVRNALLEKRIVADSYRFQCFAEMDPALEWVRTEVRAASSLR